MRATMRVVATLALLALATPAGVAAALQPPTQPTPSTTIRRDRLEQVLGGSRTSIRVVRGGGVADLPRAANDVRLTPGEFAFRKVAAAAAPVVAGGASPSEVTGATGAADAMLYRWLTVDSAGVERLLVPFFVLAGGGLTYDVASRTYRGVALVGVEDTLNPH